MAAGERITIEMSGGGPWGFRLYGGDDDPLVVAKLRKRSKAFEAGLTEGDALLAINGSSCTGLSHSGAMGIIESSQELSLIVLRGGPEKHAVDAAIQALGSQLRPVPASALGQAQAPTSSPRRSPAPCRTSQTSSPAPAQGQQQVVNGYGAAPQYHREQQTYRDGDATTRVTTETSQQQMGGTTVTKVKRETHTQFGQKPMFNVSNLANAMPASDFRQVPGTWTPAGAPSTAPSKLKVSAPSGVQVQENPDQSVTMTIGFHGGQSGEAKENIAPKQPEPPLFHVSKFGAPKQEAPKPKPALWSPGNPGSGQQQVPRQDDKMDESSHYPLLPEEEAHITAHLEQLKNPLPPHLQRVVFSGELSGSDREGTPDSPGYLTRRRIEEFAESSEDDSHKRKMFADSAFYDDPQHKYPTIEEQVKMARKVALSLLAPANKKARGHRMFMRRMVKSQKWTTDEEKRERDFEWAEDEEEEKFYHPDPWASAASTWEPPKPDPIAHRKIPAPPPIPTNIFKLPTLPSGPKKDEKAKALSADEFEKMRLFEKKTDHTQVSPAMCFSLAEDLRNMKGRGGKLFAKRVARAEKWAEDDKSGVEKKPNPDLIQRIAMQAAAGGAKAPVAMPGMVPAAASQSVPDGPPQGGHEQADGPVVNRLKSMIDPPKPKMTPWDAAATHDGNTDEAFEHLKGYNPYGQSTQAEIATNLNQAVKNSNTAPVIAPLKHLPTSGQPAKLPEYTRKIKPWGAADNGPTSAASSAHRPAAAPAPSGGGAGFRAVGFRPPGGASSGGASPASFSGGAASGGGDEVGFCDL